MTAHRDDWPIHRPAAYDAPIPGIHWYQSCTPDHPRVDPSTGLCEDCGEHACPICGREGCTQHAKEEEQTMRFGHHPDPLTDAEVEIDRLQGLLAEVHASLRRALDYRAATPEGLAIKADVRDALRRTGFVGTMGVTRSLG